MVTRFVDDFSKQVTAGVSLMVWTQEQAEKSANMLLEQSKANLESTRQFLNEIWEQNKSHQKELQNIFQQAFSNTFSNWKTATLNHIDEIASKFEELTNKFEDLVPKQEAAK